MAAALAALSPPWSACAQASGARVWGEPEVIARAAARSPEVQAAQNALDTARASHAFGDVPRVGNPVVGVRAMLGVPNATEVSNYNLTVGFPFDVSGQRPLFTREARWATREAEARLDVAVNDAVGRARASYVELAAADAILRVAATRAESAREVLAQAREAMAHGVATALDVALAEREHAEAVADFAAARRERDGAAGRFREALDLTSGDPAQVAPIGPPSLPLGLDREAAVRVASARRREIAAGEAAGRRFDVVADRSRAQYVGPIWVTAESALSSAQSSQATAGVSVQWALPLLHTGQGERAVAGAQAGASRAEAARAARRADREAGTAWDVLVDCLAELGALEAEAIPALEQTLRATERQLAMGAVDYFRLLYARRELALTRARAAAVVREAWRARVALERATGIAAARPGGGT